jgi:hypothetical protein
VSDVSGLHLRLAGVTRLSVLGRRGPRDAFVFDPHRLALPCWALALEGRGPALLVTFDRHLDLVPPADPAAVPEAGAGVRALDEHARWALDPRNVDHVLAAAEAGLVSGIVAIARSAPAGAFEGPSWRDRRGGEHPLLRAPTLAAAIPAALPLLAAAERVLLDVDLDCFTTLEAADPLTPLPWPREKIRALLFPPGSEPFWDALLPRCAALTLAREPAHCGGIVASHRLFEDAAAVIFEELFGADLP